ncbi:MAG: non-homologous end-joining DNA ligase [Candidatus Acidiferrum sp.]
MPVAQAANKTASPVKLSNPDKIYWPVEKYTKQDLFTFYGDVFSLLQPYVDDRILTLERCPDGMAGECFYQKQKPANMPRDTPTKRFQNASGKRRATDYVLGGKLSTQLALVNLGCIPIHVAATRAKTFPKSDWLCFDLDPSSGKFADAARVALIVREALDKIGLDSYPKTSGSRGLHVFVPLRLGPTAAEVLNFAEQFCARLASAYPKQMTVEHSIAQRGDRVYLDPFRNGPLQTVVSPYSVRRKPHAPVSTPLSWSEVTVKLDPASFNLGNFKTRLRKTDPWSGFFSNRQPLTPAMSKLKQI